ncbi:MAG TPA: hypothetical protein VFF17_10320 [Thermoanaerobaculia bacterium]|nr:hypothetical protein [Thermoanaerobaculia bacterium]
MNAPPLYQETQSFSPWVVVLVIAVVVLLGAVLLMRLTTTVTPDAVSIRYGVLYRTRISLSDVARAEAVEYSPIREYGGWGIRGSSRRRALNARGNQGVLLTRSDGTTLLVGSQHPRDLLDALARAGVATEDRLPIVVKDF